MEENPKKKLNVDLGTLESALENHDPDMHFYLDTETGEIALVTEDMRYEYQDFLEDLDLDDPDRAVLLKAIQEREDSVLLEVFQVETDTVGRYIEIYPEDRRAGYRTMEKFIQTLENRALQNHLSNSIRGKGAFRNFKNTLSRYPRELEQWYAYSNKVMREEALSWLDQHDIELDS